MSWQPMATAPQTPLSAHPVGRYRRSLFGPEIALLCWMDDHYVLIRGCWRTSGPQGDWWDIEAEETVDLDLVGWAPLPDEYERRRMTRALPGFV